uniref:Uncharacterized protein n=1 Tax=Rangifer tarandus platyrhynchus TaxID=3082113 RepID=A0ACB0EXW4_RANTA|nr:unnamed protein product [Rangifer tarandus platyrhynchus]
MEGLLMEMEIQKKARPSASTDTHDTAIPCKFLPIIPRLPWAAGIRDLCPHPPPGTGKALSVSSGPRPGLNAVAPHPHPHKVRAPPAPDKSCTGSTSSAAPPPGPDCPHLQPLQLEALRSPGSPRLLPWAPPETTGNARLLQTPHIIHRLSKLSQLEASGSLTSDYTSDQESRTPGRTEAKILPRNTGSEPCCHVDLASLPEPLERVSERLQPRAPLGRVPQWRGRSALTARTALAQTPADPVLLKDTLLSGKAGLCGRRWLHQR